MNDNDNWCVVCGIRGAVDDGDTCAVCAANAYGQQEVEHLRQWRDDARRQLEALKEHAERMAFVLRGHAVFFDQQAAQQSVAADREMLEAFAANARAAADNRLEG